MLVLALAITAAALVVLLTLPYWLPARVTAFRVWLFARINGEAAVDLPNAEIGVEETLALYRHPLASGRARGAKLSDLFWYWMAPSPHLHQENVEAGDLYEDVKKTTRKLLASRVGSLHALSAKYIGRHVNLADRGAIESIRLTRWFFPAFAGLYYELIFGKEADSETLALLASHSENFLAALKCNVMRDMPLRERASAAIEKAVAELDQERLAPLSHRCDRRELADYILTNFFSTGVVQLSEALAHVLFAVAQRPALQAELAQGGFADAPLAAVVKETFRLYPLFGVSHRILLGDIELADGRAFAAGTVLCLDHEAYNHQAYENGRAFDPSRWADKELQARAIPFGVRENRGCPAEGFVTAILTSVLPALLARFELRSVAEHTRSLANFAPCLVFPRGAVIPSLSVRLAAHRAADDWRRLANSFRQIVYGTRMVLEAKRLRLCERYFASETRTTPLVATPSAPQPSPSRCPFHALLRQRAP
jgi:hypothetical protein